MKVINDQIILCHFHFICCARPILVGQAVYLTRFNLMCITTCAQMLLLKLEGRKHRERKGKYYIFQDQFLHKQRLGIFLFSSCLLWALERISVLTKCVKKDLIKGAIQNKTSFIRYLCIMLI
jgi:hypothetical protein